MKLQKLNLFALLVSIAIVSCQKDEQVSPAKVTPTEPMQVWRYHFETVSQRPGINFVTINGTMFFFDTYHVKQYTWVDNKFYSDTFQHTLFVDSIMFYSEDGRRQFSGKHYVQNDTLYSPIYPYTFYK